MRACNKINALKVVLYGIVVFMIFHLLVHLFDGRAHDSFSFDHLSSENGFYANSTSLENNNDIGWNFSYNLNKSQHNNIFVESSDYNRKFSNLNSSSTNIIKNSNSSFYKTFNIASYFLKPPCPELPPNLDGPIKPNISFESLQVVEKNLSHYLLNGGWYRPSECKARDRVAIIVPFRDRFTHLPIFLKNIHPFLMKQQIEYKIFIMEQNSGKPFNRAALMNIGYLEALNMYSFDCFIFHDVDLLPLNGRNLYTCPDQQPRHMSVAIDVFGYKLPYSSIFGGVSAMNRDQFSKVNGFSNSFWGWGGEDDDMSNRLKHSNYHISRYPINIARYLMLNHRKEKANPKRYENLANGITKYSIDGLNSIKYKVISFKRYPLFTWFLVDLQMSEKT